MKTKNKIKNIIFDNDNTLYRLGPIGQESLIGQLIAYAAGKLGIDYDAAAQERLRLFEKYNLRSSEVVFYLEYGLDMGEYIKDGYGAIDLDRIGLKRDEALRRALLDCNSRMSVLTNNPKEYAERVIKKLGVEDLFENVIGTAEMNYAMKPDIRAFVAALRVTGYDPKETLFVDDMREYLIGAKKLGLTTVLVNADDATEEASIDYKIGGIYDIVNVMRLLR